MVNKTPSRVLLLALLALFDSGFYLVYAATNDPRVLVLGCLGLAALAMLLGRLIRTRPTGTEARRHRRPRT
jgi:hypothetical protein